MQDDDVALPEWYASCALCGLPVATRVAESDSEGLTYHTACIRRAVDEAAQIRGKLDGPG